MKYQVTTYTDSWSKKSALSAMAAQETSSSCHQFTKLAQLEGLSMGRPENHKVKQGRSPVGEPDKMASPATKLYCKSCIYQDC